MNKVVKIILALIGMTFVGGIIVKERRTLNDLRRRLFDMRYFEVKKEDECKK